jgi:hypothetical protein
VFLADGSAADRRYLCLTPWEAKMRNWIAGVMTVLGSLLVLAGGAVVAVRAATPDRDEPETVPVRQPGMEVGVPSRGSPSRILGAARRVTAADRLIAWGILLLVLAAITTGAISFTLGASATSK